MKRMYDYKMTLEGFKFDVSSDDLSQNLRNHILILGFNEGIEHFVRAVRTRCNVPICIMS